MALVRLDPNANQKGYSIQGVNENEEGFLDTLMSNLIKIKGKSFDVIRNSRKKSVIEWTLTQEDAGLYAPVLINEDKNLLTFGDGTAADGLQHLKVLGDNLFGFEDELAKENPDWDYNDYRVQFSLFG